MSREDVLTAVRAALDGVAPVPLPPLADGRGDMGQRDHSAEPGTTAGSALLQRFAAEARAVGTQVYLAPNEDAAVDLVRTIVRAVPGAARLVTWPSPLAAAVIRAICPSTPTLQTTVLGVDTPAAAVAAADIGVTEADCLVAASGTLVLGAAGRHRGASLLPPVHIAIAPAERVVPDLGTALARVRAGAPPAESCVTLITGPSRTGDIEKKLVLGVHGPCALHVIIVGASTTGTGSTAHAPGWVAPRAGAASEDSG